MRTADMKRLWGRSGNRCSFYGCNQVLAREQPKGLARIVNGGFEEIHKRSDVTERVQKIETTIERKFGKLEKALPIKL